MAVTNFITNKLVQGGHLAISARRIAHNTELGMKDAASEKHIIEKFLFPNKLAAVPDISPKGSQALS